MREQEGIERSRFVEREDERRILGERGHLVPSALEENSAHDVVHHDGAPLDPTIARDQIQERTAQAGELIRCFAGVLPAPNLGQKELRLVLSQPQDLVVAQESGARRRLDDLPSLTHDRR